MTEKILCAIDFSDTSQRAVRWAIDMAIQRKAHVTLLYTYRLTRAYNGEAVKMKRKMEEDASHSFATLEKEFLLGKGISYDFKNEIGFVTDRVEGYTKSNGVSFIVIDKNLHAANKEMFDELLDQVKIPLFIVP